MGTASTMRKMPTDALPHCGESALPSSLVLVVHAFGGNPKKFWYQRVKAALEAQSPNVCVEVLRMPQPAEPVIDAWVDALRQRVLIVEEGTIIYLVGHSVGCQTLIRFLSDADTTSLFRNVGVTLGGCVCVAAWFKVVDAWASIEPWC